MKSKQRVMRLTTEDGTELINPDAEQLTHALSRLGLPGNGFAILGSADHIGDVVLQDLTPMVL